MQIYLDTKDLINVLESSEPIASEDLAGLLRKAKSQLAISFASIAELAAPLLRQGAKTNVMDVLERLEHLPLAFIADARIPRMELEEALTAFRRGREYRSIDPYVQRFDQTIPVTGEASTSILISYSLAETAWDLWAHEPKLFDEFSNHKMRYEQIVKQDRRMPGQATLRRHFPVVVEKDLALYAVDCEGIDTQALGNWIYGSPLRCPAKRLAFEVWHKLTSNLTDKTLGSDLADFNHLFNLPYVGVFTADRRMRGYLAQVIKPLSLAQSVKILPSATEVIQFLSRSEGAAR